MFNEIGSNFWRYSLHEEEKRDKLWWEYDEYHNILFKSGRNAIKALARNLKEGQACVLLPIYTCETVILPFLEEEWNVDYYQVNADLSVNIQSLLKKCEKLKPRAIFFHSYFGFNTLGEDINIIEQLHSQDIIIIEDITQSIFSEHYIKCADYYVASLRKFIAIPDGGLVCSKKELNFPAIAEADHLLVETALNAFNLKQIYMTKNHDEALKQQFRKKYQEINCLIAQNEVVQAISEESKKIFFSVNINKLKQKRVQNYNQLFRTINNISNLSPVIKQAIGKSVPLYLPVYVKNDRKVLQEYLARNNIYCPIIWPKPPQIEIKNDDIVDYMYKHMLCFPIDQRYGNEEMKKISDVLITYKNN